MTKEEINKASKEFQGLIDKIKILNSEIEDLKAFSSSIEYMVSEFNLLEKPLVDLTSWLFDDEGILRDEHRGEGENRLNKVLVSHLVNVQNRQLSFLISWCQDVRSKVKTVNIKNADLQEELNNSFLLYNRLCTQLPAEVLENILQKG